MKLKQCCDCGRKKPAHSFSWNARQRCRNVWCRDCGRVRQSKRSFAATSPTAWYRKPNLSMSILGK